MPIPLEKASLFLTVPHSRAHLDSVSTTTSVAGILPLLPPREERAGERRAVLLTTPLCQAVLCPSPQPSPRSFLTGRGSKSVGLWWYCHEAPPTHKARSRIVAADVRACCPTWRVAVPEGHRESRQFER